MDSPKNNEGTSTVQITRRLQAIYEQLSRADFILLFSGLFFLIAYGGTYVGLTQKALQAIGAPKTDIGPFQAALFVAVGVMIISELIRRKITRSTWWLVAVTKSIKRLAKTDIISETTAEQQAAFAITYHMVISCPPGRYEDMATKNLDKITQMRNHLKNLGFLPESSDSIPQQDSPVKTEPGRPEPPLSATPAPESKRDSVRDNEEN